MTSLPHPGQTSPWTRACRCSSCQPSECSRALRIVPSRANPALVAARQEAALATEWVILRRCKPRPSTAHRLTRTTAPTLAPRPRPEGSSQYRNSALPPTRSMSARPIRPTRLPPLRSATAQIAAASVRQRFSHHAILLRASSKDRCPGRFQCCTSGPRHESARTMASSRDHGRNSRPLDRPNTGWPLSLIRPAGTTAGIGTIIWASRQSLEKLIGTPSIQVTPRRSTRPAGRLRRAFLNPEHAHPERQAHAHLERHPPVT